jgi:hypothetical protein
MAASAGPPRPAAAAVMPLSASTTHIALPFTAIDLRSDSVRSWARPPLTPWSVAMAALIRYYTEAKLPTPVPPSSESDEPAARIPHEPPAVQHVLAMFILYQLKVGDPPFVLLALVNAECRV